MKRVISLGVLVLSVLALNAQPHFKVASNPDILRHDGAIFPSRVNIVLPQVNGYNIYKADLHTHTFYSDGHVSPEFRVIEAWNDGLDVLAVTEHIEYRSLERDMIEFMRGYVKEDAKAINWSIVSEPADDKGIQTDLDMSVRLAQKEAEKYGLTIIPGAEISRAPEITGHFNLLFTTDNDAIYHSDPLESMKNAKAQGALIIHNHPGWRRPSLDMIDFEKKIYPMGILDGIEVMNQLDFYPRAIERAKEYGLFMMSNTDMHASTYEYYRLNGALRNMTLIFAIIASFNDSEKRQFCYKVEPRHPNQQTYGEQESSRIKRQNIGPFHQGQRSLAKIGRQILRNALIRIARSKQTTKTLHRRRQKFLLCRIILVKEHEDFIKRLLAE